MFMIILQVDNCQLYGLRKFFFSIYLTLVKRNNEQVHDCKTRHAFIHFKMRTNVDNNYEMLYT